ncbi:hypothetical protein WOLCODRAFT_140543 [Wolfiporia cocos MD-104 SS10]|uniref:Microbial-type PARG catalytic domain-containing protein n=1 Tax=Wolfiporia cocos (strain MD-104) TaxID=742152 RepID=A0A2H3J4Q1_WOLCO|nr:hypothetical protein WOLCODRAFT_140543 [Wolfiporia cocos MD-104 SS10]
MAMRRRSSRATATAVLPPFTTIPVAHDISMMIMLSRQGTSFYPHYSELLAMWAQNRPAIPRFKTRIVFNSISTLSAAHQLALSREPGAPRATVGVLSFASPKQPRGQFLQGGDEQEETVARLSSLETNLTSPAAQEFYREHRKYRAEDGSGLHDHSMVYSPGVVVFRRDSGDMLALVGEDSTATATILPRTEDPSAGEFIAPYTVNVVSAVPVHAGTVRSKHIILPSEKQLFDSGMRQVMKERMARALRLFEERRDHTVVLGAFGCGQSQNKADAVAGIWAELLVCGWIDEEGKKRPARFADSFEKVVLAVPGKWFADFKRAFDMRIFEERVAEAALTNSSGS